MRFLRDLYFVLKLIFVVAFFVALVWLGRNPTVVGKWYGKYQKAQIEEFNQR